MTTFDDLQIRRPRLAKSYLSLLEAQPGRPIALFAPRRIGKTFFLRNDLTPAAANAGLLPVYADLWLHKAAPLEAINHALDEALDDINIPRSSLGRTAKTPLKTLTGLGASIQFGEVPSRRKLPDAAPLRLDALIRRVASASRKPILLMLDEIQSLGEGAEGRSTIATVRAVLQQRQKEVRAVFTGSSQDTLAAMMVRAGGPMYQFAQLIDFPVLGDDYLILLAQHFSKVHPKKQLELADLRKVFAYIGFKPELMKDLVKMMSAEGITNIDVALKRFGNDNRQIAGWRAIVEGLSPLQKAVLIVIAQGNPPLSQESLATLSRTVHSNATIGKVRVAIEHLKRAGILAKPASGAYALEDRLFADYILSLRAPSRRR